MSAKVDCAHETMTTRFCPHCGASSNTGSLAGLLAHISVRTDHYQSRQAGLIETTRKLADTPRWPSDTPENRELTLARNKEILEKWKSWRNKLKVLLDANEDAA